MDPNLPIQGSPRIAQRLSLSNRKRPSASSQSGATTGVGGRRSDVPDSKLQRIAHMADTGIGTGTAKSEMKDTLQSRLVITPNRSVARTQFAPRGGDSVLPPVPTNSARSTPRTADRYVVTKAPSPRAFGSTSRRSQPEQLLTPEKAHETTSRRETRGRDEVGTSSPITSPHVRFRTPFDFIEHVKKNPGTLEFVYLKPARRGRHRLYSPYDLVVVPHSEVSQKDYYTLSASGITHIVDDVSDFTELEQWEREYEHYTKIKQINIFQKFRLWKGFAVWRKNVRTAKMGNCKRVLQQTLPGCNSTLRGSLLRVRGLCFEAYALRMYSIDDGKTYTLDKFTEGQEHKRMQSYERLLRIHENAKDFVFEACENVLMHAEFNKKDRPEDFLAEGEAEADPMTSRPTARTGGGAIISSRGGVLSPPSRGKMSFTDMAAKRNLCLRLVNYIRLTDYLLANALQRLVVWSVEDLQRLVTSPLSLERMEDLLDHSTAYGVNEVTTEGVETGPQMRKRLKADTVPDLLARAGAAKPDSDSPLFEVELVIGSVDELCFAPPAVDFHDRIDNIISDWVNTVRSIEPLIKNDVFHLFTHPMLNLRQEIIETGDGPKLGEIICNDTHYQQLLLGIRERLGVAFDAAFRYARVFEQFKELFIENRSMDIEQVRSRADSGDIGLADFKTMMDNFDLQHTNMDRLTEVADIGLICVDSHQLKQLVLPSPTACLSEIHKLLPQLAYAKNKALLDELNVANMELLSTPQTVKSFVDHLQYLQEVNERQDELKRKFNEITAHYELMSEYHVEVPVEEKAAYQMLQPEYTKLQASIALCEAAKENNIQKFSGALSKDIVKLRQDVMEIRGQAAHPMISDAEADPTLVIEYLMALQQTAARLDEHAKNYARYQHLFKVPIEHYDDLEAVIADLALKLQLWNSTRDWVQKSVEWTTARFDSIDPEFINTSVQRFSKIVLQVERGLPGNNVVPKLKAMVQEFKLMLPVILDLRNWALKSRHWERIEECIGRKGSLVRDETFTLGTLLDLKIMQFKDTISQISTEATQEAVLEELVTKVKNLWEQTEFTVIPFKERKDMVVLAQVDEIVALLEDSQVTVSTVAGSRYVGPIKAEVTELEDSLRLFSDTLDEWLNVQRSWIYLESIFDTPDLKSQLPEEDAAFWQVNAMYKDVMLRTRDNPNALHAATAPGLLQQMRDGGEELDRIQKSLENWLDTKRLAFPRFYFLSNDELLEILSHSRNPVAVQPHLRKLFDNIYSLEFASTDSRTPDIVAMISGEGERIELGKNLKARGSAEEWLLDVQKEMFKSMRREMTRTFNEYSRHPRVDWIGLTPAQLVLAVSQIFWAHDVVECFRSENVAFALQEFRDKCVDQLSDLAELVRHTDNELLRAAIVSLVTMDVHSRDIVECLIEDGVYNELDFGWNQRLRYYYDNEESECVVRQSNASFNYGYEYLGNTSRLVITPLTDRCYMTCTSALHLYLGSAPAGPAGTGKTETVKDLAKALAVFCVVFNCSEAIDNIFMDKFFCGLSQTGAWACLDEFNRIDIEVLSVIAQQLLTVQTALKAKQSRFVFNGKDMALVPTFGFFITMNPGYAGRTELPDNLKALFRPVSMMVPDYAMIAEIMLMSEGFENARILSRKMVKLYKLCSEQLSQQSHYDFGMRALKSILVMAGSLKRSTPDLHEDVVLIRAMRDSNVPKFLSDDLALFGAIVSDLFPGVDLPVQEYEHLQPAIEETMTDKKLQIVPALVDKVLQLYETMKVRFGVMLVGETAGKTTCYESLQAAMSLLAERDINAFYNVRTHVLNPKCIDLGELYGEFNELTHEWSDGLAASIVRECVANPSLDRNWVVFDGPVDALWIENMNTVLDDNRTLCLANGERIKLPDSMNMLFEVQDLAAASPATVSRCGMVYLPAEGLGWKPYVASWISNDVEDLPETMIEYLQELFDTLVDPALVFVRQNCTEDIPSVDFNLISSLCNLLESTMSLEGVDLSLSQNTEETPYVTAQANIQTAKKMLEKLFFFSLTWSIGGNINAKDRAAFDDWIRHACDFVHVPPEGTAFDYFVDIDNNAMKSWSAIVPEFVYDPKAPFFTVIVPTMDTMRYSFLLKTLLNKEKRVMFSGVTGVGKSVIINHGLSDLQQNHNFVSLTINFSARTSSKATQEMIEAKLEKKRRTLYGAPHGKKVAIFIDDVNMPQREEYGAQPPIELLRQFCDFNGMYDRRKLFWKEINDTTLVVACAPPGGGRNPVTPRFFRHFNMISLQPPSSETLHVIFSSILKGFLGEWDASIRMLIKAMVGASIDMYDRIRTELLPTPAKSHYTFNLRDLSKTFQGLLRATPLQVPDGAAMTRLWCHESLRVFHDRLVNDEDRSWFKGLVIELLKKHFGLSWSIEELFDKKSLLWVDFMKADIAPSDRVLEEVRKPEKLHEVLDFFLGEFNIERNSDVKLVFFRDAIDHLCRIVRVLRQTRGNAMLVGVGGSGRQSLTRLAAFICDMECFQIELTRTYGLNDFYEDLKKLYNTAGVKGKPVVFLLTESTLKEEFFETINCILNSGEVIGLFAQDEKEKIYEQVRPYVRAAGLPESRDGIWEHFIYRTRDNLHVVLCMGSIGDSFRSRCRQFPSLVNSMQVDWYNEWPEDALLSVSRSFFEDADMGEEVSQQVKDQIAQMCVFMHSSVSRLTVRFYEELRRRFFVTPKSYLDLIQLYLSLFEERRNGLLADHKRLTNGLAKLLETNEMVAQMEKELNELQPDLQQKAIETGQLLEQLARNQKNTDQLKKVVQAEEVVVKRQAGETEALAEDARRDLAEAMPALESAIEALNSLNKNDITEIRSFTKPPILVQTVMEATCVLLQVKPDWETSKKVLNDTRFLQRLMNYDKDHIPDIVLKRLKKYIDDPTFVPDNVANVSFAARSLCMWVRAIDKYAKVAKNVRPKEMRLKEAEAMLADARGKLQAKQEQLAGIEKKLAELRRQYELSQAEKASLQQRIELTSTRLERASKLQVLLGDEQVRWSEEAAKIKGRLADLVGDVFLAAACVSYIGAFTGFYRLAIIDEWVQECKSHGLPVSEPFSLVDVLGSPVEIREWNLFGLPSDNLSTENAILCGKSKRWPLLIDPEEQAKRWIINMERDNGLKRIKMSDAEYLRTLQYAISMGTPVLMEDIGEEIPAAILPLLDKAVFRRGARTLITLGDADIDYIPTFRFYMTTKLQNPVYTPEVCIRTTVINMAVTEAGLQDQLLAEVVRKERPDLEESRDRIVVKMASDKKALKDLEDNILSLLSSSEGSVLDNEALIKALEDAKSTAKAISVRVKESEKTEQEINAARDVYLSVAIRGSGLFSVIRDLSHIDPMYQYSLQYFTRLFSSTIDSTPKSSDLDLRLSALNKAITFASFSNVSRGLFEQHKMIFSFLICCKLMRQADEISDADWNVFLGRGSGSTEINVPNPISDWLSDAKWTRVCFLEAELEVFDGLTQHIKENADQWRGWAMGTDVVRTSIPGWQDKMTPFQRLMLINAMREEKTIHAIPYYVSEVIGKAFTESPPFSLDQVHSATTAATPIIFILSTGADPTGYLLRFAEEKKYSERLHMISLGQGQGPVATKMIESAVKTGDWVLLQNCHLAKSWMPNLEEIVTNLLAIETGDITGEYVHPDFRLFLTSMPTPFFPVPVLQNGQKVTNEPPRGLRANMRRLYVDMGEERFESCSKSRPWKKLLFGLGWLHALIQERRKYGPLGWNIRYEFNTSDFEVSVMVLRMFLEEQDHVPWKALKYMTGEIVYGGRVTDDWDRRLLMSLLNKAYAEEVLEDQYSFSTSGAYLSIPVNDFHTYVTYIEQLPSKDDPEVFGLDSNADIAYEMQETHKILDVILETQPRQFQGSAVMSEEDIVYELAGRILEVLPDDLTMDEAGDHTFEKSEDGQLNSLATVLTHEMDRFNKLLHRMRDTLTELQKAIRGLVVMSADLETMFRSLSANQIPILWSDVAFPSLKPLNGFVKNLEARVAHLRDWLRNGQPVCFWMSGLFFPQGFLTGVLQNHARKYKISIDKLSFEYTVMDSTPKEFLKLPEDGVYVAGLVLEGARWDGNEHCMADPVSGEMHYGMPVVYLCPRESYTPPADHYAAPVYKTSVRAGVLSTTGHSTNFVVAVSLPAGKQSGDVWTRRSAALLCELSGDEPTW